MPRRRHIEAIVAMAIGLFTCSSHGREQDMNTMGTQSAFAKDYLKALEQLRKKHGLDIVQLQEQVASINYGEQWFLKSGFGGIGRLPYPDRVVENDLKVNNITIDRRAKKSWVGADYKTPELVLLEGDKVVFSKRYSTKEATRDLTLVLFNPKRVDFFYWDKLQGGFFKRYPKK